MSASRRHLSGQLSCDGAACSLAAGCFQPAGASDRSRSAPTTTIHTYSSHMLNVVCERFARRSPGYCGASRDADAETKYGRALRPQKRAQKHQYRTSQADSLLSRSEAGVTRQRLQRSEAEAFSRCDQLDAVMAAVSSLLASQKKEQLAPWTDADLEVAVRRRCVYTARAATRMATGASLPSNPRKSKLQRSPLLLCSGHA